MLSVLRGSTSSAITTSGIYNILLAAFEFRLGFFRGESSHIWVIIVWLLILIIILISGKIINYDLLALSTHPSIRGFAKIMAELKSKILPDSGYSVKIRTAWSKVLIPVTPLGSGPSTPPSQVIPRLVAVQSPHEFRSGVPIPPQVSLVNLIISCAILNLLKS